MVTTIVITDTRLGALTRVNQAVFFDDTTGVGARAGRPVLWWRVIFGTSTSSVPTGTVTCLNVRAAVAWGIRGTTAPGDASRAPSDRAGNLLFVYNGSLTALTSAG